MLIANSSSHTFLIRTSTAVAEVPSVLLINSTFICERKSVLPLLHWTGTDFTCGMPSQSSACCMASRALSTGLV